MHDFYGTHLEQSLTDFHLRKRNVLDSQKGTRLQQQILHHPVRDVAAPLRSRELKHATVSPSSLRANVAIVQRTRQGAEHHSGILDTPSAYLTVRDCHPPTMHAGVNLAI